MLATLKERVERSVLGDREVEARILGGRLRGARIVVNRATETKMWLGVFERDIQSAIIGIARDAGVAWDVGAFAGYFTLLMERCGCQVVALEPDPGNAARTRRTLMLNGSDALLVEAAAAELDGDGFLTEAHTPSEHALADTGRPIHLITLNTLADSHGLPGLVKVDVEGAELRVLAGAGRLLRRRVPFVVETHSDALDRGCRAVFAQYGYKVSVAGNSLVAV